MGKIRISLIAFSYLFLTETVSGQDHPILFDFDGDVHSERLQFEGKEISYVDGIEGQALALNPDRGISNLTLNDISLDGIQDFSIQVWFKTTSQKPTVILSQKPFDDKGISAQKNAGWVLYNSGGTLALSIGSGDRRINYERDNKDKMPITDGMWHQIALTYSKELSEFRLYCDGQNMAIYKVHFNYANTEPLVIGLRESLSGSRSKYSKDIESGQKKLQSLVDEFNALGLAKLQNHELIDLIVDPEELFNRKQDENEELGTASLSKTLDIRKKLLSNPYTVFQNRSLTELKPVSKIYLLEDGKVVVNDAIANVFTEGEKLYPSDFALDNLSIWKQTLTPEDIFADYQTYRKEDIPMRVGSRKNLTVGVWNIWHGGIHWSKDKDGWDSRMRIVEMIKSRDIDVVLMQETYSSGDFIAAELGYYFATTSDYDYRYQGANISVISRYPIKEVQVSEGTAFNNVAAKLVISETQEIWAMSNWYGMNQFPVVFDFHKSRFENSDNVPVLFGGDFNAIPHTDGGDSPASKKLQDAGFIDAFRSSYPNVEAYPGLTHRSGERIDQLYYKGKGLVNTHTEVISTWPEGFPSDHFLIVSKFELNY